MMDGKQSNLLDDIDFGLIIAAVERVIEKYRTTAEVLISEIDDDIKLLKNHPQKALKAFQTILKINSSDKETFDNLNSEPELVPKQPFNNIDLFHRMPSGYTRLEPKTLEELITMVQKAGNEKKQIKAVGACYSFSNIAFSDGYIIEMNKHLHNMLEIDKDLLKDPSQINTLCQMEAGTLIESILEYLWPSEHRDETKGYRTMLNTTGYSGLSIAGTTGTGAHGSGIDKPPMPDCIESMHLITLDKDLKVVQFWIEPTNGITDSAKFNEKHKENIKLIQDDETFYATTVHIGSLGVVYSYIIRVQPAFYLEEHRSILPWHKVDVKNLVERNKKSETDPNDPDALQSFEIWISPYAPLHGSFVYAVVSTYKLAKPPSIGKRPIAFNASNLENELLRLLTVTVSKEVQRLLPLIMFIALLATIEETPVTMPSTEALSFGTPNGIKSLTSENGIDATNIDDVITAVNEMIKTYQDALQLDNRFFTTSPFSMRFTAASKSYLAMQYNRPTCMIETPLLIDTQGQYSTLRRQRVMTQTKYGSRPHWGQINDMTFEKLKTLYPDSYEKFVTVFKRFNVSGLFNNYFTTDIV